MKKIWLSFFLFFIAVPSAYAAPATLSFDPVVINTSIGQEFPISINIYTENEPVISTDVVINYDSTVLQPLPNRTVNGTIFQTVDAKNIAPGQLYVYGIQEKKSEVKPARGTVATIYFKALKEGESMLTFDCKSDKNNTSQIIKLNSNFENIINCTSTHINTAKISITSNDVLGAFTNNSSAIHKLTFLFGSIVAIVTCYIIMKYQRLHKDIS